MSLSEPFVQPGARSLEPPGRAWRRLAGPGDEDSPAPIGEPPDDDGGIWEDDDDDDDEDDEGDFDDDLSSAVPYCGAASPAERSRGRMASA